MNPVFRRWLLFAGSAAVSGLLLFWVIKELTALSVVLAAFGPGFCFAFALIHIRKYHPEIQAFSFIFLISISIPIFILVFILLLAGDLSFLGMGVGIPTLGAAFAILLGSFYTSFIKYKAPDKISLGLSGGLGLALPLLVLIGVDFTFDYYVRDEMFTLVIVGWQMAVGYVFSKATSDDLEDNGYVGLIKKIGTKH